MNKIEYLFEKGTFVVFLGVVLAVSVNLIDEGIKYFQYDRYLQCHTQKMVPMRRFLSTRVDCVPRATLPLEVN
jgi:hypothetical protein